MKKSITPATVLVAMVLALSAQIFAQRENYQERERRAAPVVKQQLDQLRSRILTRKLTFRVGYTYALERGVENLASQTAPQRVSPVAAQTQNKLAVQLFDLDKTAKLEALKNNPNLKLAGSCAANAKSWDWRTQNKVTPVRTQKCGNCWAYATIAAYESSYLIQNNKSVDGSEQFVVTNSGAGNCKGGYPDKASEFLVTRGTTDEAMMPDTGTNGTPDPKLASPYNAIAWGWVNESDPWTPSVQQIKQALCQHGPVITWIDAGGSFGGYIGGEPGNDVYNDDDDKEPGHKTAWHAVVIIGFDDARGAWLIKNSWGQNWGFEAGKGTESGYAWIKYGVHNVGANASWLTAESNLYKLPIRYYELMPIKKLLVNPVVLREGSIRQQ